MRQREVLALVGTILMAGSLQACQLGQWVQNGFKVGPEYRLPASPVAADWIDYRSPEASVPSTDMAEWWRVFDDPVLNSLMHDSYAQNLTLRTAGERIFAARAVRNIAVGNLFPQVQNVAGAISANKISDRTANAPSDQWFHDNNVGFNLGWEIDFWGRFRRAVEAADATLDASVAGYDNVMVILLSDVAGTYIQYRTFQQRLALARANVEIQRQAYELAQANFRAGASTERDMQQARQAYEQTRSLIPQLEIGVRQSNNALCVLLGIPVRDLSSRLGETGTVPSPRGEVVLGIPAELIRRRPDIREAERLAAAQSARIGVAESDLYPHFAITGSIGVDAQYFGGMFHTPGALAGSIGPSFRWDILNYGRLTNAVAAEEAAFRAAVLRYQQTVLQANREAEDAYISFSKSKEQVVFQAQSVDAARRTVQITYDQYKNGVVDFTPVFLFEIALTQQEDQLALTQANIALSLVNLYRALGGGWEARTRPEGIVGPPTTAPATQRAPARVPGPATSATATAPATRP